MPDKITLEQIHGEDELGRIKNTDYFKSLSPEKQAGLLRAYEIEPGQVSSQAFSSHPRPVTGNDLRNAGIDLARPLLSGGAATLAGAYTGPGAVLAAPAAYTAVDSALQALKPEAPGMGESLINTATQAVGGKLIEKIPVFAKTAKTVFGETILKNPTPIEPGINAYRTFSQRMEPGIGQTIASWMENNLASSATRKTEDEALQAGQDKLRNMAFKASGKSPLLNPLMQTPKPESFVLKGLDKLGTTLTRLQDAVAENAAVPKMIAKYNTVPAVPNSTIPMLHTGPIQGLAPIEGPISFIKTAQAAQDFLQKVNKQITGSAGIPEHLKGPINEAQGLLRDLRVKIDPASGQVLGVNPVGFEAAWTRKIDLGNSTFSKGSGRELSSVYKAMNEDIENGIKQWKHDPGGEALAGFQNARAMSALSYNRFLDYEKAPTMYDLIHHNEGSAIPMVDNIIKDAPLLKKVIANSRVELLSPNGKITIEDPKMGEFFAGRALDKLRNEMFTPSVMDPLRGTFNGNGAIAKWTSEGFAESKNLLFSKSEQSNINVLLKGISEAQKKGSDNSAGMVMKIARDGFLVPAASIATGVFSNYTALSAATGGIMLSGAALARLMANKQTARYMISLGEAGPLGASGNMVGNLIRSTIKNAPIGLVQANGDIDWGTFNAKEQFVSNSK